MTPRERILTQIVIDGLRRFYRAVEAAEKAVGDTLYSVDVSEGCPPEDPGYAPYVTIGAALGFEEKIHLEWSYGRMVSEISRFIRDDRDSRIIDRAARGASGAVEEASS